MPETSARTTKGSEVIYLDTKRDSSEIKTYPGDGGGGPTVDAETKNYVDKSMDAVKAKNDARFAEVITGIEKVNNNLSSFGDTVRIRLDTLGGDVKGAKLAAEHAENASRSVKWNIVVTGIAVAGIFLAAWAIWAQGMELITALIGAPRQ